MVASMKDFTYFMSQRASWNVLKTFAEMSSEFYFSSVLGNTINLHSHQTAGVMARARSDTRVRIHIRDVCFGRSLLSRSGFHCRALPAVTAALHAVPAERCGAGAGWGRPAQCSCCRSCSCAGLTSISPLQDGFQQHVQQYEMFIQKPHCQCTAFLVWDAATICACRLSRTTKLSFDSSQMLFRPCWMSRRGLLQQKLGLFFTR